MESGIRPKYKGGKAERKLLLSANDWKERAKFIRLLLLDVDGVLTDGRIVYDGAGRELKFFDIKDRGAIGSCGCCNISISGPNIAVIKREK